MCTLIRYSMLITLLALGQAVWAQDPPPPPPPDGSNGGRHMEDADGRQRGAGPGGRMGGIMHDMQEENPEEYARLMKLREEDPDAFRQAMRERFQAEGPGKHDGPPGGRFDRGVVAQALQRFKEENPEKFAEMEQLRKDDPEAFREKMHQLLSGKVKEFYKQHGGLDLRKREQEVRDLARRCKEAGSAEEKTRLEGELRDKLEATFDEMMQAQETRIVQIEQELEDMRMKLDTRREKRSEIVQKRLEQLLTEAPPQDDRREKRPPRRNGTEQ